MLSIGSADINKLDAISAFSASATIDKPQVRQYMPKVRFLGTDKELFSMANLLHESVGMHQKTSCRHFNKQIHPDTKQPGDDG